MKKRLALSLILAVCMVVSLALVACTPETHTYDIVVENTAILLEKGETQTLTYQATKDGSPDASLKVNVSVAGDSVTYSEETGEITAVKSGTTVLTLSIEGQEVTREVTVTVPTYTIEFRKPEATIFVDETLTISYTVKKDGANVNNKKVILSTDSDAVYLNTIKKEVTGIKPGESAVITATLEDDPEVTATMTYYVKGVFFSRDDELQRGQLDFANEDDGRVEILGGQATILARQDSTKFVFRTTLTIRSHVGIWDSFGIGSFRDKGDNALWFGLRGTEQDGIYSVYIRDFYDGWNTPSYDAEVKNYKKYEFGTTIDSNYNEEVISIQNGYVTALQVGETAVKATCGSEEVTFNVKCLPVERSTDPLYYVDEAGQGWISAARNFADQWNYYGKEGISTAFIGDSFFDYRWFFTNFYQMYQGKEAVCYGIGGTTSHTWELFIDEYFNHMQPKNIVIHVGNNNVYNDHTTEEETVIDLERFLTMLHGRMPNTHIYYFAITYRVYDDVYDSKGVIKYVNSTLNRWCEGKDWITFMDTSDDLTPETIKSDLIHPLLESYNIFKEALEEAGCEIVDKE